MMLIQFERPVCSKHHKPLDFLCMAQECTCRIRLCVSCTHQHIKKYNKSDFMKDVNFYKKLEMESEIINKQYKFIEKHCSKTAQEGSCKNEESVKLVEQIMRGMNEDKKAVFRAIDDFMFNHVEVKKKLAKVKLNSKSKYFNSIKTSPELLSMMINLTSSQGLERLKKKIILCQSSSKKYSEFMGVTQRYGDSQSQFMIGIGCSSALIKGSIKEILGMNDNELKAKGNQKQEEGKRQSGEKLTKQANRSEQLFVPLPNPGKKIKLITPQKRPKSSSSADKEN